VLIEIDDSLAWSGELTCVRHDPATGAFLIIAIDSTRRGPASGGTRAMTYTHVGAAVADARRLAGAMTLKMAAADLPMGGGKSVLALPRPRHELSTATWARILDLHAANLELLNGSYTTGPDVGTSSADMDVLGRSTRHVFGRSVAAGGAGSSADATARGVHAAIRAALAETGQASLAGRTVLVQGLGAVGARLCELLAAAGARLLVTDVDPRRCATAVARGARTVRPEEVTRTVCDVLAPCATGGLIDATTARTLPVAVVAGAANNVLADAEAAQVLAERGIVYAPDFVANSGGAIHLVGREVLGWTPDRVSARTEGIEDTLRTIFADARARGVTTERAAVDLAQARLTGGGSAVAPAAA
jgi:leucine dehydrogenase